MRNIRLLIADHNEGFANDVASFMGKMPEIDVVGFRRNGDETVKFIAENAPDAVLLELILDGLDGISVLKSFSGHPRAPVFIICTEFCNEVGIRRARQYGACCFLCKPVSAQALYDAIVECVKVQGDALIAEETAKSQSECACTTIKSFLAESGIPKQSYGYRYLCDAVTIAQQNPASLTAITKQLYPEIARINASTPARVERDIRSAIRYAHQHFNLRINGTRPTNREFIQILTDHAYKQPYS